MISPIYGVELVVIVTLVVKVVVIGSTVVFSDIPKAIVSTRSIVNENE
jgi:hypothetical protein